MKTVKLEISEGRRNQMLEQITETTFHRTRTVQSEIKFIPAENLNFTMQFVDYNKHPIQILGALRANIRSAGCKVPDASLLATERPERCILGLDLQGKMGIHTSQKSAPTNRSKFDVLLCEQSEGMKQHLYKKFPLYLTDRESLNIM